MIEQNLLTLLVLLPFLAAFGAATLPQTARNGEAVLAGATMLAMVAILLVLRPWVHDGGNVSTTIHWVDAIGLNLRFRLDGFAWLFMMLVAGIGFLVVLYARYYLSPDDPAARFFSALLGFTGAMAGVLLAGNIIVLVVFWELTSFMSFMLISYWNQKQEAREGARTALIVTASGGLCLLAAMLITGQIVGSYDIDVVLASGHLITQHWL
ncbi:MAG: proton-conducting transporter membrane subunit, partial [Paracoccus sp. (in: a-proteobacteria)]|nr:proton-conducting transporter membrane subunit [Paracoccus sp. (in: a-proteobacteria)]